MRLVLALVAVAVLALVGATIWIAARVREQPVVSNPYEEGLKLGAAPRGGAEGDGCDLGARPCTRPLDGGGEVTLALSPRPLLTMKDLAVRVELSGAADERAQVSVSFSMRGMSMGENRARLARAGAGRFEGKAVLVRCPSGRREWLADVEVAAPGAPARAARFALTVAE